LIGEDNECSSSSEGGSEDQPKGRSGPTNSFKKRYDAV